MSVFLVEPNHRYDLSAVEVYGEIKYISQKQLNPFNIESSMVQIKKGLLEHNFDPVQDYLCMTGNLQTVALMMMVAHDMFVSFRILAFDARISSYKEREVHHV